MSESLGWDQQRVLTALGSGSEPVDCQQRGPKLLMRRAEVWETQAPPPGAGPRVPSLICAARWPTLQLPQRGFRAPTLLPH